MMDALSSLLMAPVVVLAGASFLLACFWMLVLKEMSR